MNSYAVDMQSDTNPVVKVSFTNVECETSKDAMEACPLFMANPGKWTVTAVDLIAKDIKE